MMKYTGSLALGLGMFFAVPALTFGGGLPDSVETALDETLHALRVLGQLEKQLDEGKELPADAIVQVTEAPLGDDHSRDERLMGLRNEVASLQSKLDRKKLEEGIPLENQTPGDEGSDAQEPSAMTTMGVSPGLSETFIKALGSGQVGPQPPASMGQASSTQSAPASQPVSEPSASSAPSKSSETTAKAEDLSTTRSPEGKGYSADPMRQAQACFRAKRYEQGLELLEAAEPSPTVSYWTARMLERLDRIDEAIELYNAIETDDDAKELHAAAKRDREFAEWRRDFEKKAGLEKTKTEKDA